MRGINLGVAKCLHCGCVASPTRISMFPCPHTPLSAGVESPPCAFGVDVLERCRPIGDPLTVTTAVVTGSDASGREQLRQWCARHDVMYITGWNVSFSTTVPVVWLIGHVALFVRDPLSETGDFVCVYSVAACDIEFVSHGTQQRRVPLRLARQQVSRPYAVGGTAQATAAHVQFIVPSTSATATSVKRMTFAPVAHYVDPTDEEQQVMSVCTVTQRIQHRLMPPDELGHRGYVYAALGTPHRFSHIGDALGVLCVPTARAVRGPYGVDGADVPRVACASCGMVCEPADFCRLHSLNPDKADVATLTSALDRWFERQPGNTIRNVAVTCHRRLGTLPPFGEVFSSRQDCLAAQFTTHNHEITLTEHIVNLCVVGIFNDNPAVTRVGVVGINTARLILFVWKSDIHDPLSEPVTVAQHIVYPASSAYDALPFATLRDVTVVADPKTVAQKRMIFQQQERFFSGWKPCSSVAGFQYTLNGACTVMAVRRTPSAQP